MKILAVDPGYERVGFAILEKGALDTKEVLIFSECFRTDKKHPHPTRLAMVYEETKRLIKEYSPTHLAIENLFFNTNQKTATKVSEARGTILATAASNGLEITEFTPLQIKVAITGYGRSDKNAVLFMVPKLITIDKEIKYDDEYDAIACGITLFAHNGNAHNRS